MENQYLEMLQEVWVATETAVALSRNVAGACCGITKQQLQRLGGLNERYVALVLQLQGQGPFQERYVGPAAAELAHRDVLWPQRGSS